MFLERLRIIKDYAINPCVLRDIVFHQGLNLIVDETLGEDKQKTGNNVGKTTVLRLIDYCLGGNNADPIYTASRTEKSENKKVRAFLEENDVVVELVLAASLEKSTSGKIVIRRNFKTSKGQTLREIDGQNYTKNEFLEKLDALVFPGKMGSSPSFRQLISHNFRIDSPAIDTMLRTFAFGKNVDYQAMCFYMFGIPQANEQSYKSQLLIRQDKEMEFKKRLLGGNSLYGYQQSLRIVTNEINQLQAQIDSFQLDGDVASSIDDLNGIKETISDKSLQIAQLKMRRSIIDDAVASLNAGFSDIDAMQLRRIYDEAVGNINGIQKSFDDLLSYHNKMIGEKVKFVSLELPTINRRIEELSEELNPLKKREEIICKNLSSTTLSEAISLIVEQLSEKNVVKGSYEQLIAQITQVDAEISKIEEKVEEVDKGLAKVNLPALIKCQLDKLNGFFTEISSALYGEPAYISFIPPDSDKKGSCYKFEPQNVYQGTGKRQGEMLAFDIAYCQFADKEGIPCLHFLLNDKKELVHGNQLDKISEYVKHLPIQIVFSILNDKISDTVRKNSSLVLHLSQENKLFRIEELEKNRD